MTAQPPFGRADHDSIQHHAFCDGLVAAVRLFHTRSLAHASAWVFTDAMTEVANLAEPLVQSAADHLDLTGGAVRLTAPADEVVIEVTGAADMALRLTPRTEFRWPDTISTVIHQPDMDVRVDWNGSRFDGIGYCKRYTWTPHPRYWGYRFIQGYADAGGIKLWTAEATFSDGQYDYFKMLEPDGRLAEAGPWDSCHRDDGARGLVDGRCVEVEIAELGRWEAPLRSAAMDSLIRQRVCRMTVSVDGTGHDGIAINETCFGTLG